MNHILILFFFFNFCVNAQKNTLIEGKVITTDGAIEGINVYNKTTLNGTITDPDGYFRVDAKIHDTILFSSISHKMKQLIVTKALIGQKDILILLIPVIYELDEVIITPYGLSGVLTSDMTHHIDKNIITASKLGLPNADVPVMSYSERKIYYLNNHDGVLFAIINKISGRTKKNNKIKTVIRKQDVIEEVRSSFEDSLFINSLKIPYDQIDGFLYYCEADSTFQKIFKSENKLGLWEFLLQKSMEYNDITPTSDYKCKQSITP